MSRWEGIDVYRDDDELPPEPLEVESVDIFWIVASAACLGALLAVGVVFGLAVAFGAFG